MTDIRAILRDHKLLLDTLESLVEPFQRKVTNSTLDVTDIEASQNAVCFTSVLAWQGDAESMEWAFPQRVVEERMEQLKKARS